MDRYSFSGKGSILIKAGVPGEYGSEQYSANEPIAYFTDVLLNITFSNDDTIAKQGISNLVADSKAEGSVLSVQGIKVNESLQSLLYKKQTNNLKDKTEVVKLISSNGVLYLPIQSGEVLNEEIFIYDQNKNRILTFTIVEDTIIGLEDGNYTIFYTVNKEATSTYFLETPRFPNVQAELTVQGNLNGQLGVINIHLGKLKLLSRPTLDFTSGAPFSENLEFAILYDKNSIEINYYA